MLTRLLLFVPILLVPNMLHFEFDTGIPGLNLSNIVFLVLLAALLAGGRKYLPIEPRGRITNALLLLYAVLFIGLAIALATAPGNLMEDVTYIKNMIFYTLFYFLYRRCGQDLKRTRQLIIFVMVVAAIAGVEAIREGISYGFDRYSESKRASGPFGKDYTTANRAGVFYAMFLPMFIAMALFFREQKLWRIAALGGCAILAVAIMATYSRQSYIIAIVCLALLLIRRNVVMAAIIALLMVPAIGMLPESVTQRVVETQQEHAEPGAVTTEAVDVSTASRFEIWSAAMRMWQDHPLGVGLNRFKRFIGQYDAAYAGMDAHSIYVLLLAEISILGPLAFLYLLWRLLRTGMAFARATPHNDHEGKALSLGFILMVVAVALGNVYGSPFFEGAVAVNFWIMAGLLEHYFALKRAGAPAAQGRTTAVAPPHARIASRFPLAAKVAPGRYGHAETHTPSSGDPDTPAR